MNIFRFLRSHGSGGFLTPLLRRRCCSTTSSSLCTNTNREIRALFKETDPDVLAARFKDLSSSSVQCRRMNNVYSAVIDRLVAAGRPDAVTDVLEAQKLTPGITDEGFAARIVCLYGKAGMADRAAETFHQLPSLGRPQSILLLNALLSAFTAAGELARAVDALREIVAVNPDIVPDVYSYNTIIHAHCRKQDMKGAVRFFEEMEKKGISPNVITFGSLINGFYHVKMFEDAGKMWAKMTDRNLAPDVKCFNAKLRGLASAGRTAEAEEVLNAMKEKGLAPEAYSFTALIMGYCKENDLEGAKRMFAEMRKRDLIPNKGTFTALVPRLLEAGELDQALKLARESVFRRLFLKAEVLQAVVNALVKAGRATDAKTLVELAWSVHCSPETLKLPSEFSTSLN